LKFISSDKSILKFSKNNHYIDSIDLGETFWIECKDCYDGQIKTNQDLESSIESSKLNNATGPVKIEGIYKGDILIVHILDIKINSPGIMTLSPNWGILGNYLKKYETKIWPIKNNVIHYIDDLTIPLSPMVGVIGVAPEKKAISCMIPGNHGGNMDTKEITKGSKLYLPVFTDGGLFAIGDLHALMGDGEVSGSGLEVSGKVKLKFSKAKGFNLPMPIVETFSDFNIISSSDNFNQAIKKGVKFAVDLLRKRLHYSKNDAYRLLSIAADVRVSQVVNPAMTIKISFSKSIISDLAL
jgi:amidase